MNKIDKVFSDCDKCIVFSANDSFTPCLAVMIESLIENSKDCQFYDMIILHKDITQEKRELVIRQAEKYKNISIRFCNISEYAGNLVFYTENRKTITEETYFRLFLPWILSDEYTQALYLDGDMICRKDISTIFDTELGDKLIAAIRDYWGICNCYMPGEDIGDYRKSIGLTDIDNYIIAGTIIFNLVQFRKQYTLQSVLELAVSNNWRQHDQDVVNLLCRDQIKYIDANWGWVSDYGNNHYLPEKLFNELSEITDPCVVHFAGSRKPWKKLYTECDLEFWKYAKNSLFFTENFEKIEDADYRSYVIGQVAGNEICIKEENGQHVRYCGDYRLGALEDECSEIRTIRVSNENILTIEGTIGFYNCKQSDCLTVYFEVNGVKSEVVQKDDDSYERDTIIKRTKSFEIRYRMDEGKQYNIRLCAQLNDMYITEFAFTYGEKAPFSGEFKEEYVAENGWSIKHSGKEFVIEPCTKSDIKQLEKNYCREISADSKGKRAAIYRKLARRNLAKKKTQLIIATDKAAVQSTKKENILIFSSPESMKYKTLLPAADIMFSIEEEVKMRNPYGKSRKYLKDMLSKVDFIITEEK